ncbi:MAG TPA: HAD-IIIA family hydrolase [Smithellaceae bacterium]|nr:HAD-IIIA family hydrolase [Smithellaceae bacterium]
MEKKFRAVFLDRDGTLNEEVGYLDSAGKLQMIPEAFEAVRRINESGMKAVVVTNQAGVAKGLFSEKFVRDVNDRIQGLFIEYGAQIDRFYYCPHHPSEGVDPYRKICDCRKPEPGLLQQAAQDLDIDLARSYMIGDHLRDVETARRVGAKGILVTTGHGADQLKTSGITAANQPDYVAKNILEAVDWILKDRT